MTVGGMSRHDGARRLTSFEVAQEETLHVVTEADGEHYAEHYVGREPGQWALVPLDDIERSWSRVDYGDGLDVGDLEIVGDPVTINPESSEQVTMLDGDGELAGQRSTPGVYAMLRIPFER